MDSKKLIDNFRLIAAIPGGTKRLRRLILDLAIAGRLVEQIPDEQPAHVLLDLIRRSQDSLASAGLARPNRAHSPRPPGDRPLPTGWCWAYAPQLGFINPRNIVDPGATVGFVPMPLISTDPRISPTFEERRWSDVASGFTHIANGDVGFAKITPSFQNGKSGVFCGLPSGVGAATTELFVLRPTPEGANAEYLRLFFQSSRFISGGVEEMTGTAGQQRVPRQYFTDTPIPFPPLNEQKRIVLKVDELFGLCDQLEARHEERSSVGVSFRKCALKELGAASNAPDIISAWKRVQTNWLTVCGGPDAIPDLRRTVLDIFVRGRISPQDSQDEPSERLLERTRAGRDQLLKASLTRNVPDSPDYIRREPLPDGWSWAPLQDLVRFIDYRGRTPTKTSHGVPLITAKNVRRGYVSEAPREFIAEKDFEGWMTRGLPRVGDVLFTTEAPMGNAAVVRSGDRFALAQRIIALAPYADFSGDFLELVLLSPWFTAELKRRASGMTATGIKAAKLRLIRIPVPPIAEQRRMVSRATQMLSLCDELESTLTSRALAGERAISLLTSYDQFYPIAQPQ